MEIVETTNTVRTRDARIDRMKGLLCLGMILAHVLYYLGHEQFDNMVWKLISQFVNLIAFPGFLFCFGFVLDRAYLSKRDLSAVRGRLIRRFFIILVAYYVCAVLMNMLLNGHFSLTAMQNILRFNSIGGVAYLLAFALQFLILLLFYNAMSRLVTKGWLVAVAVAASLGIACLPTIGLDLPVVSLFIKTAEQSGFPLLPYFGYFVLGAYLSRSGRVFSWRVGLFALLSGLAFAAYVFLTRELPLRFPPSVFWVLGAYPLVYALYLFCGVVKNSTFIDKALAPFGKHTLYYLVATSLALSLYDYVSRRLGFTMPQLWYMPCFIGLVALCLGLFACYSLLQRKAAKTGS